MKCVILAAGEGIRMRPLTLGKPKPLLRVAGRPILEYIIEALPREIDEIVMVIGYLGEQIRAGFTGRYDGRNVIYIEQTEKLGTGYALKLCQRALNGERFMLLYADDLHEPSALRACLNHPRSLLVARHAEPERFGVVGVDGSGRVISITEKPVQPETNLVSTGAMVLEERIFGYSPRRHPSGEYYLASMLDQMLGEHAVQAVETQAWFPIAAPDDLIRAEGFLARLKAAPD